MSTLLLHVKRVPRARHRTNAYLAAAARFVKFALTLAVFAFVLAALLALDVAIWVPHPHP
jgi:hypothetical protein